MYHELIFALYGCSGDIFANVGDEIAPISILPHMHTSELAILQELCSLGTQYKKFEFFITHHEGVNSYRKGTNSGMYLKALAAGLNAVLEDYRLELLKLEEEVLVDSMISLFHFQASLKKYSLLFPALFSLIQDIEEKKIHGCLTLDMVHKDSGVPIVNAAFTKLMQYCCKPFLNQLSAWVIHGQLIDPFSEFFIKKVVGTENGNPGTILDTHAITLKQYRVDTALLPKILSTDLSQKVLFIGESVCLFGHCKQVMKQTPSMFGEKESEFSKALHSLQENQFSPNQIASIIDKIRFCAAEHLWRIVVEEGEFLSHLHRMKDFYLMGRGELFLLFIDHSGHLLDGPPNEATEFDLNRSFQLAASEVYNTEENVSDMFGLKMRSLSQLPDYKKETGVTGWNLIGMKYSVPWPLHTIISSDDLEKYNRIFRFLLTVKHVQQELNNCWILRMRSKGPHLQIWQLWFHMTYLVNNLQYYLQNDVLESQFSQLIDKVKTRKDFEAVCHAHQVFLTSVMSMTFLTWKPVYHCMMEIFNSCRKLCQFIRLNMEGKFDQEILKVMASNLSRLTMLLYKNLSIAQSQQSNVNLGMLMIKLDFNQFFRSQGHLGTTVK